MAQKFAIQKDGDFLYRFDSISRIGFHSKSWINQKSGSVILFDSVDLAKKFTNQHRVMCSNSEIVEYVPEINS